jgi:curved DNA-binding protein CbpA
MNYYEELGLTPDASPEEIHQAHRKLTKLLHPDQQTDETLRRLAEAQMRRLNSIVDVLSDSDSRKQYDKGVKAANERLHYAPSATNLGMAAGMEREDPRQFLTRIRRYVPWWVWSTVGALTLTFAAVWFFADDLGSSFGGKTMAYIPDPPSQTGSGASIGPPPAASTGESRAQARFQDLTDRLRRVFETKPSTPPASDARNSQAKPVPRNEVVATVPQQVPAPEQAPQPAPPVPAGSKPLPAHDTEIVVARQTPPRIEGTPVTSVPAPLAQTPSLPKPAPLQPPTPAPAVSSQDAPAVTSTAASNQLAAKTVIPVPPSGLEGEWIYAPAKPEKRKPGLFPPDFIELRLFRAQGELHGFYHARYQVDQARDISPEVSFQLSAQEVNARTLNWESSNGSRGWLKVNSVDKSTIKVQWQTTVYSKQPSLTAGVATLIRR